MFAIVSAPHLNGSDRLTVNGLSDIVIVLAGGEKKKKKQHCSLLGNSTDGHKL